MNNEELAAEALHGDRDAMEQIVKNNERLIWSIVKRFEGRGCDREDLFQLGALGLVKAIKNFDVERGLALSTYAVPMIMGEIKRFLRDDGPVKVSRSLREIAAKAKSAANEIALKEGREAKLSEIAEYINMEESEIAAALSAVTPPDSINRNLYSDGECGAELGDILEDRERFDEKVISALAISKAAGELDGRLRTILKMRYFNNMTQSKVAELLGISQVQVSRLEKKMLMKLRKSMEG